MDKQDAPQHGEDDSSKVAEASLDKVRQLLFGQDDRYLAPSVDKQVRQSVSGVVSEALIERERKDGSVNKILVPLVERSIDRSIEVNRDKIVGSLYPLVGSLVRKAVSAFLVDFVEKTNNIIESSFSVRGAMWRFRAWQAGIRYSDYVAAQIYQYKIDQLLIIHRETGTLLVSVAADESKAQDADLLSSMLVAINDFVADAITQSASSESSLHEVKTDAVTLQIKVGPEAILVAAVVGKLPPDVQVKLQTTLEEFHHFYNQPLAAYEGDNSEFQSAQGVLIDCLVSDKREAYRKPAGWKKIPVWLLLLALVGFGCVQVYQNIELTLLTNKLRDLDNPPGIIVNRVAENDGQIHISLLRDSAAMSATAWLAEKGIDANKVTISERPYLSVEPAIVQQKASQLIAEIPTLEVNLQSDSLLLSGQLSSQQWLALNQSLQKIPGIDALTIDSRALKISANQSLDVVQREALIRHYRNRITQFAVTFEVDASQLNATQRAYLGDLAQDILALQAILSDTGSAPKILIIGSSDQTGVASKNKALSAVRAEAVKRALVEQGVPSTSLIATGIGELPIDNQSGRMVLFTLFPQSLLGAEDVEQ